MLDGCQGKPQISVKYRICPQCGNEIEIFSIDAEAVCENCGFSWTNHVMIDRENYCPKCGKAVTVTEKTGMGNIARSDRP